MEEVLKTHALKVREGFWREVGHLGCGGPVLSEHAHSQTLTWDLALTHPSHPAHSSRAQDADSLSGHLIVDHPVKVAFVLQFLHSPPQPLLQRHAGLQASQGPKHWAVSPQGLFQSPAQSPPI